MSATPMFRGLLYVQWKQQRFELLAFATIAALAPPLAMFSLGVPAFQSSAPWPVIGISPVIGAIADVVAIIVGALLAVRPFNMDLGTRHTYALSLPVRRSSYVLLRAATGLALLLLPTIGFLIGAEVAAHSITLPAVLHAYPIGLTLRFLLAAATAFAFAFALQYTLGERAASRVVFAMAAIAVIEIASQLTAGRSLILPVLRALGSGVSPFRLFAMDWTLFDV